jgi:hypothetical protein
LGGRNTKTKRAELGAAKLSEHHQGQLNIEGFIPITMAVSSVGTTLVVLYTVAKLRDLALASRGEASRLRSHFIVGRRGVSGVRSRK